MKRIILDTDFLMHCAANKVDYIEELRRICDFKYQTYIIDKTLDELDNIIEKKKGKHKFNAKLAKLILNKKKISQIKTKKHKIVDKLILENTKKNTIVATMDANLKRVLKRKGIPVIVLRQRKYLSIIGV
ncbi:nucleotide-binding protein [Candidatus Woesearchaeota archaeon]|nr:nucleotide-binding protein [Candidatus Woesearchaeota archaeon]